MNMDPCIVSESNPCICKCIELLLEKNGKLTDSFFQTTIRSEFIYSGGLKKDVAVNKTY